MSKVNTTIWKIEPHTEAKHIILKKYLNAWLPIITRYNGRVLYIDGFAGPGEYIGGKDGSPIIALNLCIQHRANIEAEIVMNFIEADKERCEYLKQKIAAIDKPNNIKIDIICSKFDETLNEIFNNLDEQKAKLAPAFVFIDPFGFTGIPFCLIKKIMENKKCEVFITFMYEEINRFISLKKLWPNLEETFGTDAWKAVIPIENPKQRCEMLHNIYRDQLKHEAGVEYVRSFKMKNKTNRVDYYLFFGTNNIMGLKKMKEAMWKVDELGAFEFSDATYNPAQATLFAKEPNYFLLKKILLKQFKNKITTINDIEYFIITKTPFRETHYKRRILGVMEKLENPEIKRRCDRCIINDCKKRKGSFPHSCCNIEFL